MASKKKLYLLYADKEKSDLLAIAYDEDQILEETQYYTEGVWFVYDEIDGKYLENPRKLRRKIEFPETPKERFLYWEKKEDYKWIK